MTLHIIQLDRHQCEVPGHSDHLGTDWDHCIFKKNNKKGKPEFAKFVNNPFNMLRACAICNRITHLSDRWESKKWLIDHHLDSEYRDEFLEWVQHPPPKFQANDMFRIYNYIAKKTGEENSGENNRD